MEETIDKLRKGMYRRITLRFEFDLNTALDKAKNSKGARSYSAFKKRIENKILKQLEKEDPIPGKNVYLFDWFLPDARKDPDNVAAGKKVVFDSLCPPKRKKQKAGRKLIPNDSMRYIHSFDDQFHLDKTDPRLEITIVPA